MLVLDNEETQESREKKSIGIATSATGLLRTSALLLGGVFLLGYSDQLVNIIIPSLENPLKKLKNTFLPQRIPPKPNLLYYETVKTKPKPFDIKNAAPAYHEESSTYPEYFDYEPYIEYHDPVSDFVELVMNKYPIVNGGEYSDNQDINSVNITIPSQSEITDNNTPVSYEEFINLFGNKQNIKQQISTPALKQDYFKDQNLNKNFSFKPFLNFYGDNQSIFKEQFFKGQNLFADIDAVKPTIFSSALQDELFSNPNLLDVNETVSAPVSEEYILHDTNLLRDSQIEQPLISSAPVFKEDFFTDTNLNVDDEIFGLKILDKGFHENFFTDSKIFGDNLSINPVFSFDSPAKIFHEDFFSDQTLFESYETFKSKLFAQGFHDNFFSDNQSPGKKTVTSIVDLYSNLKEDYVESDLNSNDSDDILPFLSR